MRFGLSTHLFHHDRLSQAHLSAVAASGFDLVELFATRTHFDYHDARHVRDLARWLEAARVEAGSMHAPICEGITQGVWGRAYSNASPEAAVREEAVAETRRALDAAAALGCRHMVVHLGLPRGPRIPEGDNDQGAVLKSLEALAAASRDTGVGLALEVIPNDLSTPAALLALLQGDLDLSGAGLCFDFGHAHMLGDAAEAAERLAAHTLTTHLHDNHGREDSHLVPFAGSVDWEGTLAALVKGGYGGPLVFEVADLGDARATLDRTVGARARLQAILDSLRAPFPFEA
jgi:sugar phosphate isomerase/epimerase